MNTQNFLAGVKKINTAYIKCCKDICDEFGIQQVSFDILMFLASTPDCYLAKDISEMSQIKTNVVSIHVESLVEDGYLERCPVDGDRRKVRLVCTEKAAPLIEKGKTVQRDFYQTLTEGLSEEEINTFKHCLNTFQKNTEKLL